ncbi:hypothetical protein F4809DRAFT_614125 [Biscogniauxia mediterranea]|nr:hypothetical protein F4809DRAFT_614125 [Biscogniauxia mediterranea]
MNPIALMFFLTSQILPCPLFSPGLIPGKTEPPLAGDYRSVVVVWHVVPYTAHLGMILEEGVIVFTINVREGNSVHGIIALVDDLQLQLPGKLLKGASGVGVVAMVVCGFLLGHAVGRMSVCHRSVRGGGGVSDRSRSIHCRCVGDSGRNGGHLLGLVLHLDDDGNGRFANRRERGQLLV